MADGIYVEFKGMEEAEQAFDSLPLAVKNRVREVVKGIALAVQKDAKERCPVDTGRLRSSIHVLFRDDEMGAEVGTNVNYAGYVEFGTSRMRARPYMFPAAEEQQDHYTNQMAAALKAAAENPYKI